MANDLSRRKKQMIPDFSIKSKPSNKKAKWLFAVSLIASFLIFAISSILPKYQGLVSLLALSLLVLAMTVYTKYVTPVFYYDITTDSEGTPLFIVRQLIGKRETTLCRIGLAEIIKVEREDRSARRSHKTPADFMKYSYLPTLDPDVIYRLSSTSRYEKSEILVEISDEMASLIRKYAVMARQEFPDVE